MPLSLQYSCTIEPQLGGTFGISVLLIILSVIIRQYSLVYLDHPLTKHKHKRVLYIMTS